MNSAAPPGGLISVHASIVVFRIVCSLDRMAKAQAARERARLRREEEAAKKAAEATA